jgi:hypothetical protein
MLDIWEYKFQHQNNNYKMNTPGVAAMSETCTHFLFLSNIQISGGTACLEDQSQNKTHNEKGSKIWRTPLLWVRSKTMFNGLSPCSHQDQQIQITEYSMKQRPSCKADRCSTNQDISHLLWNQKVHCSGQNNTEVWHKSSNFKWKSFYLVKNYFLIQ